MSIKGRRSLTSVSMSRTLSSLSTGTGAYKLDGRPAIVIEIGTRITRIGTAGDFCPREMFVSEFIDPLMPTTSSQIFCKDRSEEEQHLLLVRFFKNIILRKLITTANNRRVVIVESVLAPTKVRNSIAKALFECPSLAPHSIVFAPSHLLCTFPFNAKNCLVIDIGVNESTIFTVAEGFLILYPWESLEVCTSAIERRVRSLLLKHGKLETENGIRDFTEHDLPVLNTGGRVEDIVCRFCFATTMRRGHKLQANFVDPAVQIDDQVSEVHIPFGDDTLVIPGIVREASAEIFFEDGGINNPSIPQAILNCVSKVGIDLRRELLRNLIVVGGITRMPGFLSRLKSELLRLIATGYTSPRLAPSIDDIRFHQFPRQIAGELFCAWLGGSLFGALDGIENRGVLREDWLGRPPNERIVPDWTFTIDDHIKILAQMQKKQSPATLTNKEEKSA